MTKLILEVPKLSSVEALLPLFKVLGIRVIQVESPAHEKRDLEEALRIVRMGCDMSNFGDALEYQKEIRQDRVLPFRDNV
jgi:hypothetical protein